MCPHVYWVTLAWPTLPVQVLLGSLTPLLSPLDFIIPKTLVGVGQKGREVQDSLRP